MRARIEGLKARPVAAAISRVSIISWFSHSPYPGNLTRMKFWVPWPGQAVRFPGWRGELGTERDEHRAVHHGTACLAGLRESLANSKTELQLLDSALFSNRCLEIVERF